MRSYFFVPGTRYKNIQSIVEQGADEIIIDLEDAVKGSERTAIMEAIKPSPMKDFWIRVPLRESFEQNINDEVLRSILSKGFKRIVLPKLISVEEFKSLLKEFDVYSNLEFIILIEHPKLLNDLDGLLSKHNKHIRGVGLGSHDLMSFLGAKHNLPNLEYPRQKLLYDAKAAEIECIDIASMELYDEASFTKELSDGFEKGFDAKFLIHPWQLNIFNNTAFFSEEDIKWARLVLEAFDKVGENLEFSPVVINNEVIERPHIKRAKMIIEKVNRNEGK